MSIFIIFIIKILLNGKGDAEAAVNLSHIFYLLEEML